MTPQHTAYIALAFTSLVWSGNTIAGRALADAIPPAAFSFWRWTLILVLLAPLVRGELVGRWPVIRRSWRMLAVLGLISTGLYHALIYWALQLGTGRGAFVVTPEVVAGIAYCAILASIVTTATLNYGVDRVGATRASFFTHLVPVFGAVLGVTLLGERLGWYHLAGFAFILAGIAVSNGALGALSKALRPG